MKNHGNSNILFLIAFILFVIIDCYSQQIDYVSIKVKNELPMLTPGKHYTTLFEIRNHSDNEINLKFEYKLPNAFSKIFSHDKKVIGPHSKKNILLTFLVSKKCPSGKYGIEFNVFENNKVITFVKFNVKASKHYDISISPTSSPVFLRFEKDFYCDFSVKNNGNSEERIAFNSTNGYDVNPKIGFLKPDSSLVVRVKQNVPSVLFDKTIAVNDLSAKIVANDMNFANRISIPVYPSGKMKPDLYHRFPISVTTIFNSLKGYDTINAVKYRIEGSGYLDRNNDHHLKFLITGPNQIEFVRFGEYDEYNVQYRNKKTEVVAGDISFTLSSLTEVSRYGFGAVITQKIKNGEASIFYLKPRFSEEILESYGGKLTYYLSNKSDLTFGLIDRTLSENDEQFKSIIYSLSSNYTSKKFNLNGEFAYENNYKTHGFGVSLESSLSTDYLYWGNSFQYSDETFKGYLRNSKQFYSFLNLRLSKKITTQINGTYRSINPVRDSINYNSSPIISNYQAKIRLKLNRNNLLKFGGSYRKKEDRFSPKKFNFEEKLFSLSYFYRKTNNFNFNITNRIGTSRNFLADDTSSKNVFFSSIEFSKDFSNLFTIGLNGDFEQTNKNSLDNELINSIYYGGQFQCHISNLLDVNFYYRNNYASDELDEEQQSYIEGQLDFNFNKNHALHVAVSQSSIPTSPSKKELFLTASYRFTLNVPLSKDKTHGIFKGKINNIENDRLEDILITLDNKIAVTNKKGEFIFYNLEPKEYLFGIVQSSLPKNKTPLQELPLMVNVFANEEVNIDIDLTKTGSVTGEIILEKSNDLQSSNFINKFPNIIVKISNNKKKYLTKTSNLNTFKFAKLNPGKWTIELLVKKLHQDFTFDKVLSEIVIKPDENVEVTFFVKNKKRTMIKSKKSFKL